MTGDDSNDEGDVTVIEDFTPEKKNQDDETTDDNDGKADAKES